MLSNLILNDKFLINLIVLILTKNNANDIFRILSEIISIFVFLIKCVKLDKHIRIYFTKEL